MCCSAHVPVVHLSKHGVGGHFAWRLGAGHGPQGIGFFFLFGFILHLSCTLVYNQGSQ